MCMSHFLKNNLRLTFYRNHFLKSIMYVLDFRQNTEEIHSKINKKEQRVDSDNTYI